MQQRQLRLGDILDDYCPRERRVTNHAVVAMVGEDVKQTRCTTCDAEHEYKQAKVPPQRKKKAAPGALYQEVLAGIPRKPATSGVRARRTSPRPRSSRRRRRAGRRAERGPGCVCARAGGRGRRSRASAADPRDACRARGPGAHAAGAGVHDSAAARQAGALPAGRWRWRGPARTGRAGANGSGFEFGGRRNAGAAARRPARRTAIAPVRRRANARARRSIGGAAARSARSSPDASIVAPSPDGWRCARLRHRASSPSRPSVLSRIAACVRRTGVAVCPWGAS